MGENVIPLGNPVIVMLAMMEEGHEFEVVVPDDRRGERVSAETDGE